LLRKAVGVPDTDVDIAHIAVLTERVSVLEAQLALSEKVHVAGFWWALDAIYDHTLHDRKLECIVCGHTGSRNGFEIHVSNCIFGGGRLERYGCPNCECIFGAQKFLDLSPDLIDLDYQLLYSRYKEADNTANEVRTFKSLLPDRGRSYVNWGSGAWNGTIGVMRAEGWDLWGYEPSAPAGGEFVATQKEGLPAAVAGLFSNNVIEHFTDPVAQFEEYASVLPAGARMAHSSPCYEYTYAFTRFHTVFLTGRSPEVLAGRTGFKIVDRVKDGEYINVVFERM
jgi:hypothetical protein